MKFSKRQLRQIIKEEVEAAGEVLGPQIEQALSGIVKGPPTRRLFEVYEPKA